MCERQQPSSIAISVRKIFILIVVDQERRCDKRYGLLTGCRVHSDDLGARTQGLPQLAGLIFAACKDQLGGCWRISLVELGLPPSSKAGYVQGSQTQLFGSPDMNMRRFLKPRCEIVCVQCLDISPNALSSGFCFPVLFVPGIVS